MSINITKYFGGMQMAWIDGPPSQNREYKLPISISKEADSEKAIPPMSDAKVCKVTEERTEGLFGLLPASYDYDDLCTDVTPRDEGEDILPWFERQQARLNDMLASRKKTKEVSSVTRDAPEPRGFCFTGNTHLLREDGSTITFSDMAQLARTGAELPAIASWRESGEVVYQQPTAVIEHEIVNSTLLFIAASDSIGSVAPLQVTENHPLMVECNGDLEWVEAGDLQDGDMLVGPNGSYLFDKAATLAVTGGFGLYDLSFTTEEGTLEPTYLVSNDGNAWLIAHNKVW